ncbi:uncharacterized protein LOC122009766 [Zingiber officinale]|uniref:Uncharacterized protein n=1 Tax=Zingiber officinale TaxID=94328 RepID=A0A8J5FHG2_ZINOF|nr:uncharacterized protein LOC122009766 [Zingiber officinale]KAG6487426.1 hypothetical protein ZIOFF_056012 [Zingiber officinale]
MGKRLPSPLALEMYARVAAERIRRAKCVKPYFESLASSKEGAAGAVGATAPSRGIRRGMDERKRQEDRLPLEEVVADCTRRWFLDALKEARAGDTVMQVLVGQMYRSGYGVLKNEQKANAWFTRASKYRTSVWKVSHKLPGYNASDSDSDGRINIKS